MRVVVDGSCMLHRAIELFIVFHSLAFFILGDSAAAPADCLGDENDKVRVLFLPFLLGPQLVLVEIEVAVVVGWEERVRVIVGII